MKRMKRILLRQVLIGPSPFNPFNHRKAICFLHNKFLRND